MIDYKKAEQAKKLLEESGVDYVFAYVDDNGKIIGNVQGTVLKAKYCAVAIIQAIGEQICDSHGDKFDGTGNPSFMEKYGGKE